MRQPSDDDQRRRPAVWKWVWAALLVLCAIGLAAKVSPQEGLKQMLDLAARLGGWGPVLYIAVYTLAAVFFIPGSVLTLGAGAVFGLGWGSLYSSAAATLGATAAFGVGRYLARDWVARRVERNPRFAALDRAVAAEGWKIVGLTRLSPLFPYTLLNYAFGLTRVGWRDYIFFSWLGMLPGTVMYVYLGSVARAAVSEGTRTAGEWGVFGIGFVATVGVTVAMTRLAKKALEH